MVAQNPILSEPDGGGTDPQILKPRYLVHGGTESHVVRSDGDGTDPHIINPGTYCSAWWPRITYCQIRMVAAQILRSSNPGI